MKKNLFFCVALIIQLSLLFSSALLSAAESGSVSPEQTSSTDSKIEDVNKNNDQDKIVKICPECDNEYSGEVSFCGLDGAKLIIKVEESLNKIDSFPESTNNEETAADLKESNAAKFANYSRAMEFIKTGDLLREKRNDFKGALVEYRKALELVPDNMQLHYKLAGSYWKAGNKKKALEHLDLCKKLYPKGSAGITKIDQYITKLERGLSVEEKEKRQKEKGKRLSQILAKARKENKEKWNEMVLVPEGKFLMGSKDDEFNIEEMPQHEVYLSPYYIDKFEVTNGLYAEFLDYMKETNDHSKCYFGEGPNKDHTPDRWYDDSYYEHADWPVVKVDWYDAYAYAAWAGKRLPTEAEWEKAARGTDGRRFPWGNVWDSNKCNAGTKGPLAVGSYEGGKSVYGVYDMSGSVQEWCNDWHHAMYYKNSPSRDPKGPLESTNLRVIRGSSLFANNVYQMRNTIRWYDEPHRRNRSVGFRCAKDVNPEEK